MKDIYTARAEVVEMINACESYEDFNAFLSEKCTNWKRLTIDNRRDSIMCVETLFIYNGFKCSHSTRTGEVIIIAPNGLVELGFTSNERLDEEIENIAYYYTMVRNADK